jgi:cell division protein FtsI (penicillin-binding protein 3)
MRVGSLLFAMVAVVLCCGAGRLIYIEYQHGPELRERADRQHAAKYIIPAQRGDILDARGRMLAGSIRRPSVFMDPKFIKDPRFAAASVAQVLSLDADELFETIMQNRVRRFVWVKRRISDAEHQAFEQIKAERKLRGFVVRLEPQRYYPYGRSAAHVLGFVGTDDDGQPHSMGRAGLELQYDDLLRGAPGEQLSMVDARGRRIFAAQDEYHPPVDGATVISTIDIHLQQLVETRLREAYEEFSPQWASAIVMDPHSGEVLAMAGLPDFNPTAPLAQDPNAALSPAQLRQRLHNAVVENAYEPGSIFKPFIMAPALDAGLVVLDEPFKINGPVRTFGRRRINDTHAYGVLTAAEVIVKSSNIGMALLGERVGNERLYDYVTRLGFGELTQIGLPGESGGLLQPFARWTDYSTRSITMGQEVAATPIQLLTAFAALANDGVLYRPRIVRGVIACNGDVLRDDSAPDALRRVISPEIAKQFRDEALVRVVNEGTARRARLEDYQLFGKTGTAQVARQDGKGYEPGAFAGSFICGAPADRPQVVVLVTMYKPPHGKQYYGGIVAAPTGAAIIADTLEYLQVPPDKL